MPSGTIPVLGQPRTGYGSVPNPIGTPDNIFAQLSGALPGFRANTSGTGSVIGSQLAGNISPMTLNALKTGAAQFGIGSGMGPGSGLETNQLFGNIAGYSEGQQQRGVQNYLSEVGALGPTMTNPNLAAEIASHNAELAAAPDPRMAADAAFQQWLRGFNYTRSAGGSYGGGPGSWNYGGTLGPAAGFSTTHSNWGGMGLNAPDSLGFPSYDMTPGFSGTIGPVGAINPTQSAPQSPWNSGFVTGPRSNMFSGFPEMGGFYPGLSNEEAVAAGEG